MHGKPRVCGDEARRPSEDAQASECLASPVLEVGQRYTGPSPVGGQPSPSVVSQANSPQLCCAAAEFAIGASMTSMREERLQERVAEIRPRLAKAREIAEKAEAEKRP